MNRILKKTMALFMTVAVAGTTAAIHVMAEESVTNTITATSFRTIGGWSGSYTENTLDIADKQGNTNNSIYTRTDNSIGKGHDINVGFMEFIIPENIEITDAKLKLTSSQGQYGGTVTAYTAVADLTTTVVSGQTPAGTLSSIDWENRPQLTKTAEGVSYTVGGSSSTVVSDTDNNLIIPLKDSEGNIIVNNGETVVLAVYFIRSDSVSAREVFSAAEIEYSYAVENLTTDQVIWANDIAEQGGIYNPEKATNTVNNYGNFKNTDDTIKIFFPEASDGSTIEPLDRVSNIDNAGNSKYTGYIEADVTAAAAGKGRIYILGSTNQDTRAIEATNTTTYSSGQASTATTTYSTGSDSLRVMVIDGISFNEGVNTIKIQAPSGANAPNFIAMYIDFSAETAMSQVSFSGTYNGEQIDGKEITENNETITAWKGDLSSIDFTISSIEVIAEKDGVKKSQEYSDTQLTTTGDAIFYVLINTVPDSMSFIAE